MYLISSGSIFSISIAKLDEIVYEVAFDNNILLFYDLSLNISYHHEMNVMYLNISNNYKQLFKNRKYAPPENISPHYTLLTDTDLGAIYSSKELF